MEKNKPLILYINMARQFGGGEVQTERLIGALSHFQAVFYGRKNSPLTQRLKQQNVQILPSFWALICFLHQEKNLIIHACDGRSVHLAALLKHIFAQKMVVTRHVVFPLKRFLSRWSYRQADRVIGVSQKASDNLKAMGIQTTTIYGSVDKLAENEQILSMYTFSKNRLKVGQIGNFQAVKNFPLTIELAKRCPETDFYLVGSGELETQLKQQADGLQNVFFIPFTPYVGSILQQIDVQILPSHSEGLAAVILEGYQYGVPIIAHAVGGIPEIVEHGVTGFLIEKNTVVEYQSYIQQLQPNMPLLAQLTQQTQQYWQQHDFSSTRMAKEYEQFYTQILEINQ